MFGIATHFGALQYRRIVPSNHAMIMIQKDDWI